MVASWCPQAVRPPYISFELEVKVVDQMYKYHLNLIRGEKATWARMHTIAKVQVIRPSRRKLVFGLVTWQVPKLLESEAVELAWIFP